VDQLLGQFFEGQQWAEQKRWAAESERHGMSTAR
jgi:hypothetical protein